MGGRQKYKRAKMVGIVEIRKSPLDPPIEAYALDISYGGIAVNVTLPLAGKVNVTIYFTAGSGEKIGETVSGHIIWCKPSKALYKVGIEFDGLNANDHPQLFNYIKAFTGSAAPQPI